MWVVQGVLPGWEPRFITVYNYSSHVCFMSFLKTIYSQKLFFKFLKEVESLQTIRIQEIFLPSSIQKNYRFFFKKLYKHHGNFKVVSGNLNNFALTVQQNTFKIHVLTFKMKPKSFEATNASLKGRGKV